MKTSFTNPVIQIPPVYSFYWERASKGSEDSSINRPAGEETRTIFFVHVVVDFEDLSQLNRLLLSTHHIQTQQRPNIFTLNNTYEACG